MTKPINAAFSIHADSDAINIEAAADGTTARKFKMNAYTGAQVQLGGWMYPVVIDFAGMHFSRKKRPILLSHDPSQIVGHSESFEVSDNVLKVTGVISGTGAAAQEVVANSDNGFPWQASIGASAKRTVFVPEGKQATANGKTFDGPCYMVRASQIYEVSFVPLGADDNTSASVAASKAGAEEMEVLTMDFELWAKEQKMDLTKMSDKDMTAAKELHAEEMKKIEAEKSKKTEPEANVEDKSADIEAAKASATDAENKRVVEIMKLCGKDYADIAAAAIADKMATIESVKDKVLAKMRDDRPVTTPAIHMKKEEKIMDNKVMEAALCKTAKLDKYEESFYEKTLDAADKAGAMGVQELIMMAAEAKGHERIRKITPANLASVMRAAFGNGEIKAGFSTMDVTGILSNTANKFMLASYNAVESTWRQISAIRSVRDFKTVTSYRLTSDLEFEKVGAGGELKHGTAGELSYTNKANTYGKMFAITRNDIINDDLGALSAIPAQLGRGAALGLNKVFWTAFMDNAAFFAAGNNNYVDGATTALSLASLDQLTQLFKAQTDTNGDPLGVTPTILLVPPSLEMTAKTLMAATEIRDTTASTKYPTVNPFAGMYTVVSSSYLSNVNYTGYSSTAWYLLANPMDIATIEMCFLDGVETPTIENAEADFNTLGIQMRGYFDFGATKQDFRGGVKSKGAAA